MSTGKAYEQSGRGKQVKRDYYDRKRERRLEYQREYRARNAERELAKQREYQKTDAYKQAQRRSRMKQYGITVEDYDAMLLAQDGRCAVCDRPMFGPHIDHDHVTGEVRGLLCRACNQGLGIFEDDVDRLLGALTYLHGGG